MFPTHLGIGLDENSAVVIVGDTMTVVSPAGTGIGRSAGGGYVAIADPTLWEEEPAPGELPYCGSGLTRVTVRLRSLRARILSFF
jgi:hypothetical protein